MQHGAILELECIMEIENTYVKTTFPVQCVRVVVSFVLLCVVSNWFLLHDHILVPKPPVPAYHTPDLHKTNFVPMSQSTTTAVHEYSKCISMSVFTHDTERIARYQKKVPETIATIKKILGSEWEVFLYYDSSVKQNLLDAVQKQANVNGLRMHWYKMSLSKQLSGTFWRYYTYDKCNFTIMRDAELPFENNDAWAYAHFMSNTQKLAFVQLAHARTWKEHRPVLGGTYMMKNMDNSLNMTNLMHSWPFWHYYGSDEVFIGNVVHPKALSIVYYEPRKKVIDNVRLDGMQHLETYVQLPSCYHSAGKCS